MPTKPARKDTPILAAKKLLVANRSEIAIRIMRAAKTLGHTGYQYSHEGDGAYIPQAYLPEGRRYYEPSENGCEKRVKERLDYWRALFEQSGASEKAKS